MPIDIRTGVLIIGIVFISAAVLMSVVIMFGKGARIMAGTVPRVAVGLVGAALIVWALVMSRAPTTERPAQSKNSMSATGGTLAATAITGPTTAPGAAASAPTPSTQAASEPPTDIVLVAGAAFDSCAAPTAPGPPPDGATATRQQMLAAQSSVKAFDAAIAAYTSCLNSTANNFTKQYGRALSASSLRAVDAMHVRINNSAVDVDQALADKFNRQLRIFKARQGS